MHVVVGGRGGTPYLRDVQATPVPLAVAEHDEDAGLAHGGTDAVHLLGLAGQRVLEVLVHELHVVDDRVGPDAPEMYT